MKTSHEGLLFSLASMLTLGVSNYLYKRSTDVLGPTNTTFFYYLFSSIIAIVVWLLFRERVPITAASLFWPALLAAFLFTSVWTFNYAVKFMDVSVASTIRSLSFTITILLAIYFSHEHLTTKDWIAVAFAVIALVFFGLNTENLK
jgi:drug/metabolite transporter (DMT)-like permease